MVYEQMAAEVERSGGMIRTGCPVQTVIREGNTIRGIKTADGSYEPFDHVISTMDLPSVLKGLGPLPDEVEKAVANLAFRNTIIVYLHIGSGQLFPDQWIYVHSPDLAVGRITNFRNWVPELCGSNATSVVALEYWCYDQDAIWNAPDDQLVQRAKNEILASGLLGSAPVFEGQVRRRSGLRAPIPFTGLEIKTTLKPIIRFLRRIRGLTIIGRSGSFKYNNQDHSMLMGILAAENLLLGASHDLWSVNTDSEYQEAGSGFGSYRESIRNHV